MRKNPRNAVFPDICVNYDNKVNIAIVIVVMSDSNNPPKIRASHIDPILSSLLCRQFEYGILILGSNVREEYSSGQSGALFYLKKFFEYKNQISILKLNCSQIDIILGYYGKKQTDPRVKNYIEDMDNTEILIKKRISQLVKKALKSGIPPPLYNKDMLSIFCHFRHVSKELKPSLFDTQLNNFFDTILSFDTEFSTKFKEIVLELLSDLSNIEDFAEFAENSFSKYTKMLENWLKQIYLLCPELKPLLNYIRNPNLSNLVRPKKETPKMTKDFQKSNIKTIHKIFPNTKRYHGLFTRTKWIDQLLYCLHEGYASAKSYDELEYNYLMLIDNLQGDSEFKNRFKKTGLSFDVKAIVTSLLLRNYHHHIIFQTILCSDQNEFRNAMKEISKSFLVIFKTASEHCGKMIK